MSDAVFWVIAVGLTVGGYALIHFGEQHGEFGTVADALRIFSGIVAFLTFNVGWIMEAISTGSRPYWMGVACGVSFLICAGVSAYGIRRGRRRPAMTPAEPEHSLDY